jgi:hypothetical protein
MIKYHVVSPAYGRDYKSEVGARNDWLAGKDFVYENIEGNGRYCSKRDFGKNDVIELRFNRKTDFTMIQWPQG